MLFPVVLAGVVVLAYQYVGFGLARRLDLTPRPQHYTELYLEHPATLPAKVHAGIPVHFAFVIANHEAATRHYAWQVVFLEPGVEIPFATGDGVVASGASSAFAVRAMAPLLPGAATIEVRLSAPAEHLSIHVQVS